MNDYRPRLDTTSHTLNYGGVSYTSCAEAFDSKCL